MRSTIATKTTRAALIGLALMLGPSPGLAAADGIARLAAIDGIERLVAALLPYAGPERLPTPARLRALCADDPLCAAGALVAAWPEGLALEALAAPDTDTIRMATTPASVGDVKTLPGGGLKIELLGFGRTAWRELFAAIDGAGAPVRRIEIDLRANAGGDLGRMIEIAATFVGGRARAFELIGRDGVRTVDLPAPRRRLARVPLAVRIGPNTASSAEILAALLRQHAGAVLVGARSRGKDRLTRLVPVSQGWRLRVVGERVRLPGTSLSNGLAPDLAN